MNYEEEIKKLNKRLDSLQASFIQAQKNQVPITAKADSTIEIAAKVEEITPYTETKTAYIDDTQVVFKNVPSGTYSVSFNKSILATRIYKEDYTDGTSTIIVEFEPLEEVTEVTLTIN